MRMFVDEAAQLLQALQWRRVFAAAADDFQDGPLWHRITVHNRNLNPLVGTVNARARPFGSRTRPPQLPRLTIDMIERT